MHVLITGANGFVGSTLARILAVKHDVTVIVRDGRSRVDGVEAIAVDLSKPFARSALPQRVDAVIHLAQSARYRDFPGGAMDVFEVNVGATARLLDHAAVSGASRFVLASSGAVYEPFAAPMNETCPLAPVSMYAVSKSMAESTLAPYASAMHCCALRLFFPYGAGQRDRLVPGLVSRSRNGDPVPLDGPSGDGTRLALISVTDTAAVIARALEDAWEGAVNVAGPEAVSIRNLAAQLGELMGKTVSFEHNSQSQPGELVPDISRLRSLASDLGFQTIRDGLATMLESERER